MNPNEVNKLKNNNKVGAALICIIVSLFTFQASSFFEAVTAAVGITAIAIAVPLLAISNITSIQTIDTRQMRDLLIIGISFSATYLVYHFDILSKVGMFGAKLLFDLFNFA